MKVPLLAMLGLLVCSLSQSQTIEGIWSTGKENTTIEIMQEEGEWIGKIKSSDNDKAPIGKVILKEVEKQGDIWTGELFVIKKQKWVQVEISPFETNLTLLVSAGFSKKKVEWQKS